MLIDFRFLSVYNSTTEFMQHFLQHLVGWRILKTGMKMQTRFSKCSKVSTQEESKQLYNLVYNE